MAYYITNNRSEAEAYNAAVTAAHGHSGSTTRWADVIEHPTQEKYAIQESSVVDAPMELVESLSEDWTPQQIDV